jgi:hypothetical protein
MLSSAPGPGQWHCFLANRAINSNFDSISNVHRLLTYMHRLLAVQHMHCLAGCTATFSAALNRSAQRPKVMHDRAWLHCARHHQAIIDIICYHNIPKKSQHVSHCGIAKAVTTIKDITTTRLASALLSTGIPHICHRTQRPIQLLLQPKYFDGLATTTLTAGHCVHTWSRISLVTLPPGYTQYPAPQVGPQVVLIDTPEVMTQQDLPKVPQSGLFATQVPWGQ